MRGLDLSVEPGTVFGLIGPNGAGKTTTLRMLVDIVRPTSGSASVLGEDPRSGGAALRRRIGYLPGDLRLDGRICVDRLLARFGDISGPVAPGAIAEPAERLGLDLRRQVHALSKGNRQKIGIVQAFIHRPDILILDEPTSGLDPLVQREFIRLVEEARFRGQTVLLSSHVLSEIQQAADTVAVLSAGRVVATGDVDSLRLATVRRVRAGLGGTDERTVRADLGGVPRLRDLQVRESGDVVRVTGTSTGGTDELVRALARHRIVDLALEEPDLEESVLALYGSSDPNGAHDGEVAP